METLEDILGEQPVAVPDTGEMTDDDIIEAIHQYKKEAEEARLTRDHLTERNFEAYLGQQDWSHKIEGQSTDFVPKVPVAIERLAAFVQKGLTSYGQWFQVTIKPDPRVTGSPITEQAVVNLLRHRLEDKECLPKGCLDFPTSLSDALKVALLGSLVVLKVHGFHEVERVPVVEEQVQGFQMTEMGPQPVMGEILRMEERPVWKLAIELVRPKDYFPDPTGRGLYEIQVSEVDLFELYDLAQGPDAIYDLAEVEKLLADAHDAERAAEIEDETGQRTSTPPDFRKKVKLEEFWGTILDEDGMVAHRNVVCTLANDHYLVRKPTPNPNWHQESPFVTAPLLRVPFSVWHKAVYDHAVDLQLALNELFNLIQDGAMASVWGVREVRPSAIENWSQFADGVPQGATLLIREDHPHGSPVMATVTQGQVPGDALQTYQILSGEFDEASLVNDPVPPQRITATQAVKDESRSAVMFDRLISDLECQIVEPVLRKAWLTMLQNADNWSAEDVVGCMGSQAAELMASMSPARRYATLARGCTFDVDGLSSVIARNQDFQKFVAMLQVVNQNPLLLQAFMSQFSADKAVGQLLKILNINPEVLQLTEDEMAMAPQRMQQLAQFQALLNAAGASAGTGIGGPAQTISPMSEDQQVPASVNQQINPLTGIGTQG